MQCPKEEHNLLNQGRDKWLIKYSLISSAVMFFCETEVCLFTIHMYIRKTDLNIIETLIMTMNCSMLLFECYVTFILNEPSDCIIPLNTFLLYFVIQYGYSTMY